MSKRRRRLDWPWPSSMTFKQIVEDLGASNVADRSTDFSFGGDTYDIDDTDDEGKWRPIYPRYDDLAGAKKFFDSNGFDVPERLGDEEDEEYLERLNEKIIDTCRENDYFSPMMNYYYEIDLRYRQDPEELQARLDRYGGSCILVLVGGDPKLCLAGGGMDLTWDIVWAYILCGQLPPTKYCDLPEFAGHPLSKKTRLCIAACRKSIQVHQRWLAGDARKLNETVKRLYEAQRKRATSA